MEINEQEKKNLQSYESENAFRNFHVVGLKYLESRLIAKYFLLHGARVLDIGCGYGRTTKPLVDLGYSVVGIDVVPRMIETARREYLNIDFRLMSAVDLNFADNFFEYALFSFNGIDYIYPEGKRSAALCEIWRVLKPGGICILTSHNRAALLTHLSLNTLMTLWRTFRQGLLTTAYVMASYEGGDQVTFCKMPIFQVHDFHSIGFKVLLVTGKRHKKSLMINFFESWPYFVLQKPHDQ